jgi:hypothetical protein
VFRRFWLKFRGALIKFWEESGVRYHIEEIASWVVLNFRIEEELGKSIGFNSRTLMAPIIVTNRGASLKEMGRYLSWVKGGDNQLIKLPKKMAPTVKANAGIII